VYHEKIKSWALSTEKKSMDFHGVPRSVEEVLELISRTPTGRKLLDSFLPLRNRRKITIECYPIEIIAKLKQGLGEGQPIGACFVNNGEMGTIYVDMTSPIGVLAPFLVHEIAHSLDANLWEVLPSDESQFKAELKAFEYQSLFQEELKERFSEYQVFLSKHFPKAKILHDRLNQLEIANLYGFKVA
jgi:hypothetical protein